MLRDAINRAMLEALERIEQIDKRLAELQALHDEKESLRQFCNVTSALLEQYGLSRPVLGSAGIGGLKRVDEADFPIQASKIAPPEDDRLWKMIHMVMGMEGVPMTAGKVLQALEKQHVEINGNHKREQVRTAMLRRDDIFERVGRGLFALKAWDESVKRSVTEPLDLEDEIDSTATGERDELPLQ